MFSFTTHMILEESSSEGPDAGEDEVDLVKLPGRVGRSVVFCQQAVQERAQRLNTDMARDAK